MMIQKGKIEISNYKNSRVFKSGKMLPYLFIFPTFASLVLFMYLPAIYAFGISLTDWNMGSEQTFVFLKNFIELFHDDTFYISLKNVSILSFFSVLTNVIPPLITAELLFHLKNKAIQYYYRYLFAIPAVVPGMVVLMVWSYILNPSEYVGLVNNLMVKLGLGQYIQTWFGDPRLAILSIILIGFPWASGGMGVGFLIYLSALNNISASIFESAELDGIRWYTRITKIDIPLIMGQIKFFIVLGLIWGFQTFNQPFVLTAGGGPGTSSITPVMYLYNEAFLSSKMGYASAIGVIVFVIIMIFTLITQVLTKNDKELQ